VELFDDDFVRTNFGTGNEHVEFVQEYLANGTELPSKIKPYLLDDRTWNVPVTFEVTGTSARQV